MGGVVPASPIVRVEVVHVGFMTYRLVGYDKFNSSWPYVNSYGTKGGARRAARRILSKQDRVVVVEERKF